MSTNLCACGSSQTFATCCQPIIDGSSQAVSAEQLMRARYVAYTMANIDFISATHDRSTLAELDLNVAQNWATRSTWLGLEIIECVHGGAEDVRGTVEFKAHYRLKQQREVHHEVSEFVKHDGKWFYLDGRTPQIEPQKRGAKIGRNDSCPCGSGKKYKKCCATL